MKTAIIELIEKNNVNMFYVGNQGSFDSLVIETLKEIKKTYSHINYSIVLAYLPVKSGSISEKLLPNTLFPDGQENVPPKYAIYKRNLWMIKNSEYIITYVRHSIGGAAQFKEIAEKKGKFVINLI